MPLKHTSEFTADFNDKISAATDNAAGGLVISRETGNILIAKRSESVENPNTFGLFGGRFDDYETPEEALEREIFEETGYPIFGPYHPISVFLSDDGDFAYHTQMALSPNDFEAELNWEHTEAKWVSLDELLAIPESKMHHGLYSMLQNEAVTNELSTITNYYQQNLDKNKAVEQDNDYSY